MDLDEFPSLEFAATAVALALSLRALALLGKSSTLLGGEARIESARARDLVGAAVLVSAVAYAVRVERASVWFLSAAFVALLAHSIGFYLRARARKLTRSPTAQAASPTASSQAEGGDGDEEDEDEDEDEPSACNRCGSADVVELTDTGRYLPGLLALGAVSAAVCRACGALSGQLEDTTRLQLGREHGTALRAARTGEEPDA